MFQPRAAIVTLAVLFGGLAQVISVCNAVRRQVDKGQVNEGSVSIVIGGIEHLLGMRHKMLRYIQLGLMGFAALWAMGGPTSAAEVQMRLRGSDLTFTGQIISFDGKTYRVDSELFGSVNLDIGKYECLAGACGVTVSVSPAAGGPDFGVHGSSTVGSKLMPELIGAYAKSVGLSTDMKANGPGDVEIELLDSVGSKLANIDLKTLGSDTAFPALAEGKAQIGMSSRTMSAAETALLPSYNEYVLALDGLLVIVSPQNPMAAISMDQLAQVFSGEISDWTQLGLAPGEINVHARSSGSGTFDSFRALVLEPAQRKITPNALLFESNAELSDAVANDPQSIGVTSFAYQRNAKALAISTDCGITYSPSVFDVKAEEYPLARRLFLYTNFAPSAEHAMGVLNYALSNQAQKIISGAGFIDQSVHALAFKNQGDRIVRALDTSSDSFDLALMRQMVKEIGEASRMSVTFRFRSASFALDSASQRNVEHVAALLSSDQLRDKEILLLGFSDAVGAFDRNRELSLVRARQVKQALLSAAGGKIDEARVQARGYSELIPIGCDSDSLGRAKNRRVEIWLKGSAVPSPEVKLAEPKISQETIDSLFEEFVRWRANQ